jgi:phage tail sheath protein FI
MPENLTPGVKVQELEIGAKTIEGVSTSTAGFLGLTERGPTNTPKLVTSFAQFGRLYGGYLADAYLPYAVDGFFRNGGQRCFIGRIVRAGAVAA